MSLGKVNNLQLSLETGSLFEVSVFVQTNVNQLET